MTKKNILIIGDSPSVTTGFSTVILNIFKHINRKKYELAQIGVNYEGDPHKVSWKIYPAGISRMGDIWGLGRLSQFTNMKIDLIFILNDIWVIKKYLEYIKKVWKDKTIPKIVVYFPVDGLDYDEDWFTDFDIVSKAVVYTQFGFDVCKLVVPDIDFKIIPHGIDKENIFKSTESKETLKKILYPDEDEFINSFIVLNANRNQPRKMIDATIEGFYLFAKDKPKNVKLHLHMGLKDAGIDIVKLMRRYNIENRLIVTNNVKIIQNVSRSHLNLIYNATDVGVNTSWGEGWGLVNMEHAFCGIPQIVPDSSACKELFYDVGVLMPAYYMKRNHENLTVGTIVHPSSLAQGLQILYENPELMKTLGDKSIEKFSKPEYDWKNISKQFQEIFDKCLT